MNLARPTLVILLFFLALYTYGGNYRYQFRNYGVNDGLPSSQVYTIVQDNKGYIWFGTDHGLVRYNGYEFKTFHVEDGLSTDVIFKIDLLPNGHVACYGKDRRVNFFNGNRFYGTEWSKKLRPYISTKANLLGFDISEKGASFYTYDNEEDAATYIGFRYPNEIVVDQHFGATIWDNELGMGISSKENAHIYDTISQVTFNGQQYPFETPVEFGHIFSAVAKSNQNYYFSLGPQLFRFNPNKDSVIHKLMTFDGNIFTIEIDREGHVYIGTDEAGVWKLPNGKLANVECMIPDISGTCVFSDKDGGLWVSSLYEGLFYCPNQKNKIIDLNGETAIQVRKASNKVFLGLQSGKAVRLIKDQLYDLEMIKELDRLPSSDFIVFESRNGGHSLLIDHKSNKIYLEHSLGHINEYVEYGNDFFSIRRSWVRKYSFDGNECDVYSFDLFINSGLALSAGELLLGTDEGVKKINTLALKEPDTVRTDYYTGARVSHYSSVNAVDYKPQNTFFRTKMRDMESVGDSIVVYGSAESGLLIQRKGKRNILLNKSNGLISNAIDKVHFFDERLVVSSFEGLSVISEKYGIQNFTNWNGLPSNKIYDFTLYDDTLLVTTDVGTSIVIINEQKYSPIPLYLTGVKVEGKSRDIQKDYELQYNESVLDVTFEGLSFVQEGEIEYQYQLMGVDKGWVSTNSSTIRYTNIPDGEFSFWLRAKKLDKAWTKPECLFVVKKEQPIWENGVFIFLAFLFTTIIIAVIVRNHYRRREKEEHNKLKVLNLERKTLQAQMNPHFMFNSLTSLQNLIIKDDKEGAQEYLGRFSRLTRLALTHSTQNFIPFSQEIELLEHYVKLERIRFSDCFDYEFKINLEDKSIYMAPMLVQPFIENAIRHGLSGKDKDGKLHVEWKDRDDKTLFCIISDNGVGRANSKTDKKRRSLGIGLVKERLDILLDSRAITIQDLIEDGEPAGTRVTLILPFKYSTDESIDH